METTRRLRLEDGTIVTARFDPKGQMHWCSHWHLLHALADCGWVTIEYISNGWNAMTVRKS